MANVTLSVTETAVNVSTVTSNITVIDSDGGQTFNVAVVESVIAVTAPVTNVIVSETAGVSPEEVRGYLSNTSPILYNATTGVIGFDSNASFAGKTTDDLAQGVTNLYFSNTLSRASLSATAPILYNASTGVISIDSAAIDIANANVTLKEFHETVYDNGNISGNVTFDLRNGTIHKGRLVANVTNITFANATAGSGITLLLEQDNIGNWVVQTTNLTNWEFAGNIRVINNEPNSESMIVATYDGSSYKTSWIKFDEGLGVDLSGNNTDQLAQGSTNLYFSNTLARGAITVTDTGGDGSLTYSNSTGVLTYTGPSQAEANVRIAAAPLQVRLHLSATSPINYDNQTGIISLSSSANITTTGNISGGNLLATRGVFTSNVTATGLVTATGNITSSGNISGNYFIGNGSLLTGVTSLTNAQVVAYIATQPLTVGGNLTVNGNINATGNINVQNVTDLYVRDQIIVLNANAATNANVEIISNRPTATNTSLKWNEQATRWEFTNNGTTYYPIPTSTTDLAEGANLYYTTNRANSAIGAYQGAINTAGNITTSANVSGQFILGNGYFLTGIASSALSNSDNQNFNIAYVGSDNKVYFDSGAEFRFNPSTNVLSLGPGGSFQLGGGNALIGNLDVTGLTTGVNASFTGTVIGGYFDGDGSNLDNITTTIVAEGTRLYYTTDRANTAIGAYQGAINTAGNITTSANVSGQYILGNGAFLSGLVAGNYSNSNVVALLANLGSNVISSTANISTTADINVSGNVYGNMVASQINHPQPFGAILMNSIFVDELAIGRNPSNRIFISSYGGETVSQGQYLRITNTSPQTATFENFGLSFSNIGTFGNVSAGDPANISYSQDTASVVRATLSGNVADITVTGVGSGDTGWIIIAQDVTGGRQLTLGSAWKMEGCTTGNPVNIARGSNEESLMFWTYDGSNYRATLHPNIGSNVSVDLKTTGNVSGNYILGNGAFLTGITTSGGNYGDSNVTTLLANFGSNVISSSTQVNVGANLVANSSVITVTNGSNFIPYAERNLGLTIDRNNNTANASASVVTGSNIAYRGGFSPDRIVFSGTIDGYFDGQPVTINGFTDATLAGALNGNVFYLRMRPAAPGTYDIYSNPSLTTAVNLAVGNLTGTSAGPGTITFTRRNSVTPKEWALNLDQVNNDLRIKEDGTTRVTVVSGGNVDITGTANANAIIVNQPGTAGTYANTAPVDASAGIITGGSFGDVANVSNVFVSIFNSSQRFPVGSPFQLTFSGVTGPGNVNINGQTFYSNGYDIFADASAVQLFTNSAATTPANAVTIGILPGNGTGSGNVSFTFTAGSAGSNWKLSTNGKLNFSLNGVEKANIDSAGNISTSANVIAGNTVVNGVAFNTAGTTSPSSGQIVYNSNYGTHQVGLTGSNVMLMGQDLVVYARNDEANTLSKGEVVYISGASGDKATVRRAINNSDNNSATTIGIVKSDIATGQLGYIVSQGVVDGINLGAYTAGDKLYLGNVAGTFTNVKPSSPAHYVFIGVVERANAGNGQVLVRVQNGFELDEIHDVFLSNVQQNDMLIRNAGNSLWVNQSVSSVVANTNVTLKQFSETRVALGNVTGDQSSNINLANGSIFTMTATGNLTISSVTGATAGSSATLIITQDGTGSRLLTSTMKFAGGGKTLSTTPNAIDIISLFYDGTTYYATLSKGYA